MRDVEARGPNFVYARDYLLARIGERQWDDLVSSLPPEHKDVWTRRLLVTGVYPFSSFKAMLAALADFEGSKPAHETAKMYEYIAEQSLSTVHKFFFRLADPAFVIKRYPLLWTRFFNAGKVQVPHSVRGQAGLIFDVPNIFLDWLYPACLGYSSKAVEVSGGRNVALAETSRESTGSDDSRVGYRLTWER